MTKTKYRFVAKQGGKLHIATDKDGYTTTLCERPTAGGVVLGNVWSESLTAESVKGKTCKKCANYWWADNEVKK